MKKRVKNVFYRIGHPLSDEFFETSEYKSLREQRIELDYLKENEALEYIRDIERSNRIAPLTMAQYYEQENLPSHFDYFKSMISHLPEKKGLPEEYYPRYDIEAIISPELMVATAYVTACHRLNLLD